MSITRTAWTDDDGTGTTGTVINNAEKTLLYNQIDAALAVGAAAAQPLVSISGRIAFPATQVPSSNVNTLDDYEEGTWTPVLGGDGGQSGQTYGTQIGTYTKIGRVVHVCGAVSLTAKGTITGLVQIKGLPFASVAIGAGCVGFRSGFATNWVNLALDIGSSGTATYLVGAAAAAAAVTNLATADISNTTGLYFQATYLAA